jgi:AcrR family transcriptional regulator
VSTSGPDGVLDAALGVFLSCGFHAATVDELEQATGLSWDEMRSRFVDKEGLFFAATEQHLNALSGSTSQAGELEAVVKLLGRVSAAGSTVRLRAQHRDALQRLTRLAEAAARR